MMLSVATRITERKKRHVVVANPIRPSSLFEIDQKVRGYQLPDRSQRLTFEWLFTVAATCLALSFSAGCASIGPSVIERDRLGYNIAVSVSWKEQTLLNIVRLRYADAPVFLDVTQVISSYSVEGEINFGATFNPAASDTQTLGFEGRYIDKPTITYTPIIGERFNRLLLTPVPPHAIFSMIQAGWPVNKVFRLLVREINGITNQTGSELRGREADPEFFLLVQALRRIQLSAAIGIRINKTSEGDMTVVIFFGGENIPEIRSDIDFVIKTLRLDPQTREFRLVFGLPQTDREIGILSRSMLEVMNELASSIDVPKVHLDEQRTLASRYDPNSDDPSRVPLIRVYSGYNVPSDSHVAVRSHGYWFWIDDRDFGSKRVFAFLMILFSLAETGAPQAAPVVTIPVN